MAKLIREKENILGHIEEDWRQKSRATWLKAGDRNTRFFHRFSSQRMLTNSIWEAKGDVDAPVFDDFSIKDSVTKHFYGVYSKTKEPGLLHQLEVLNNFPRYFNCEEANRIERPVTRDEVFRTLKLCCVDKSLGPDGWTLEFYLFFFDMLGDELTEAIEESRSKSQIPHQLNHTYITLIPKVDKPGSFDDYKPISLCNLFYKLISKIIAERIKSVLGASVSGEQFAFLPNRHISDAVGVAQECLHSIKSKRLCAFVLKLDLQKYYGSVDWDLLRLILLQIGLPVEVVNWIYAYCSTHSFAVLINGTPSDYFHGNWGLRQGCPLSPYLFILAMEALSLLITKTRQQGSIMVIRVARDLHITHLLLIDDVLLVGAGTKDEWLHYHQIINVFYDASGLRINASKSSFICQCDDANLRYFISGFFPFAQNGLEEGIKYLGFKIKPCSYEAADWNWLVLRVSRRINSWESRWLTLGGRLILVQSILQSLPVYWFTLFIIPLGTIDRIRRCIFNFL